MKLAALFVLALAGLAACGPQSRIEHSTDAEKAERRFDGIWLLRATSDDSKAGALTLHVDAKTVDLAGCGDFHGYLESTVNSAIVKPGSTWSVCSEKELKAQAFVHELLTRNPRLSLGPCHEGQGQCEMTIATGQAHYAKFERLPPHAEE